jgi:hypothetical protein
MGTNYYLDEKCEEQHLGKLSHTTQKGTFTWESKGKVAFELLYKDDPIFFVFNEYGEKFMATTFLEMLSRHDVAITDDENFC